MNHIPEKKLVKLHMSFDTCPIPYFISTASANKYFLTIYINTAL